MVGFHNHTKKYYFRFNYAKLVILFREMVFAHSINNNQCKKNR